MALTGIAWGDGCAYWDEVFAHCTGKSSQRSTSRSSKVLSTSTRCWCRRKIACRHCIHSHQRSHWPQRQVSSEVNGNNWLHFPSPDDVTIPGRCRVLELVKLYALILSIWESTSKAIELIIIIIFIVLPNGVKCQRAKNTCWNG